MPRHVFKTIKFELCSTYGINLFKILCRTFHGNNICVTFVLYVRGGKEDKLTAFWHNIYVYISALLYIYTHSKSEFSFPCYIRQSFTNKNVF